MRVKYYYFLNRQVTCIFECSKEPSLRKKMQKRFVITGSYLVKVLPTSDQFYSIMLDNLYVKHNISNLGDANSLKY